MGFDAVLDHRHVVHTVGAAGNRRAPWRILLVDDDVELGAMLSEYLSGAGFNVAVKLDGDNVLRSAQAGECDAIVLDVMLPGANGIEVLRQIRRVSAIPVIMLTAQGNDIDRVIGLEMGADDYVPKPVLPRELVARIRAVLRRTGQGQCSESDIISLGELSLYPSKYKVEWRNAPIDLTLTEFKLMEVLMQSRDLPVTKDCLSESALGRPREPYDRSVDVHISHLRHKLQAAGCHTIQIETVRAIGYLLKVCS